MEINVKVFRISRFCFITFILSRPMQSYLLSSAHKSQSASCLLLPISALLQYELRFLAGWIRVGERFYNLGEYESGLEAMKSKEWRKESSHRYKEIP